jgi:hypothetical protein
MAHTQEMPGIPSAVSAAGSSPEELARRVAVLKRFRELLLAQRERFRSYLEVLDKQKDVIEQGSTEDLIAHVEMEEKIVADIFSIQKVIDPLEDLYRAAYAENSGPVPGEIPNLKAALEGLKNEAVVRTGRNKELLSKRMTEIRSEIKGLRANPYAGRSSIYAETSAPSMIDIKG